ncbi:MAG: hypothetical protein FJ405_02520 [Verrucomicrobia bacterium]|nr:hypothetical protein [Verrucomicrobiota bacterium]
MGNNIDVRIALTNNNPSATIYDASPALTFPRPVGASSGSTLQFHFDACLPGASGCSPAQPPQPPQPQSIAGGTTANQKAAMVHAFYWLNWFHDELYRLGFDATAGAYQQINPNCGSGAPCPGGGDGVLVNLQHFSSIGNGSAFGTPLDGGRGSLNIGVSDAVGSNALDNRDLALDNQLLFHEYAHLMIDRLVGSGGISNQGDTGTQYDAFNEGTADFFGFAFIGRSGDALDGTYAHSAYSYYKAPPISVGVGSNPANYYYGSRPYPYSTDRSKNPVTFGDMPSPRDYPAPSNPAHTGAMGNIYWAQHARGQIWCQALLNVRKALLNKHTSTLGFQAANDRMVKLVIDAMKLMPAGVSYLEARDCILLADLIHNGGADQNEIWGGFSSRGMGYSAIGPSAEVVDYGFVEAFDMPPSSGRLWDSEMPYVKSFTSPAVGPDGTIYIGTRASTSPPLEGTVRAFNRDGTPKWTHTRGYYFGYLKSFDSSPAVGSDGTIYIGCDDGYLYAIWPGGTLRWSTQLVPNGAAIKSSPAIGSDGTIYIGADATAGGSGFHAVNGATGAILWSKLPGERVSCSAIIDAVGNIYVGSSALKVYSWTSTGAARAGTSWPVTTIGEVDTSLAIGNDGRVVAGTTLGRVYAWSQNGASLPNWGYQLTPARISAPVIDGLNNVYVGSANGLAFSLHPAPPPTTPPTIPLHFNWWKNLGGGIQGAPLLLNGEKALFVSTSGKLSVLNALSGDLVWENLTSGAIHVSPNISHDARVYITTEAGKVHAIPVGARVLMNPDSTKCPWPMFGRQRSRTGNERQWTQEAWVAHPIPTGTWFDFCVCSGGYAGTMSACHTLGGKGLSSALTARVEHSSDLSHWLATRVKEYTPDPLNDCYDKPAGWVILCDRAVLIDPPHNTYSGRYTRLRSDDAAGLPPSIRSDEAIGYFRVKITDKGALIGNSLLHSDFLNAQCVAMKLVWETDPANPQGSLIEVARLVPIPEGTTLHTLPAAPWSSSSSWWGSPAATVVQSQWNQSNLKLLPGSGIRVTAPAGETFYLLFGGIIPQGESVNSITTGLGLYSSKVPKAGTVKAILGFNPPNGTKLRKWNPDSNSWEEFNHTAGNWMPSDPVIGFGEGFLVEAPSAYTWRKAFTIW